MDFLKFDLLSLFKAPEVKEDLEIDIDLDEYRPMPVEYMETDTSFTIELPEAPVEEDKSIHVKLYEISTDSPSTLSLNPLDTFQGGSENFQAN